MLTQTGAGGSAKFEQDGKIYDVDDLGNINAGYTAGAAGIPGDIGRAGGSIYQAITDIQYGSERTLGERINDTLFTPGVGDSFPLNVAVQFDEPADRLPVKVGDDLWKKVGFNIDEVALRDALTSNGLEH